MKINFRMAKQANLRSKGKGKKKLTTAGSSGNKASSRDVGVVYARVSSPGLKVERSRARQIDSSVRASEGKGNVKIVKKVSEIVSGSLPMERRRTLLDLLAGKVQGMGAVNPRKLKVFVESARAIARDALVGEQLYQLSKKSGVQIVAADFPNLFTHTPSPAESFIRKVMLGVQELDRDQIVYRLAAGLNAKRATSSRVTQVGTTKVNGCKSLLEKKKPTKAVVSRLKKEISKYTSGQLGLRTLAVEMGKVLRAKIHHETARRIMAEIKSKKL